MTNEIVNDVVCHGIASALSHYLEAILVRRNGTGIKLLLVTVKLFAKGRSVNDNLEWPRLQLTLRNGVYESESDSAVLCTAITRFISSASGIPSCDRFVP
jgi:hypothetical protein